MFTSKFFEAKEVQQADLLAYRRQIHQYLMDTIYKSLSQPEQKPAYASFTGEIDRNLLVADSKAIVIKQYYALVDNIAVWINNHMPAELAVNWLNFRANICDPAWLGTFDISNRLFAQTKQELEEIYFIVGQSEDQPEKYDLCRQVLYDLSKEIHRCCPGVMEHITTSVSQLTNQQGIISLPRLKAEMIQEKATLCVVEIKQKYSVDVLWEVHLASALINSVAEEYHIPKKKDALSLGHTVVRFIPEFKAYLSRNPLLPKELVYLLTNQAWKKANIQPFYQLLDWSMLPKEGPIGKGQLYILISDKEKDKEKTLTYRVMQPTKKEMVTGDLTFAELKLERSGPMTVEQLIPYLPKILAITTSRGHTGLDSQASLDLSEWLDTLGPDFYFNSVNIYPYDEEKAIYRVNKTPMGEPAESALRELGSSIYRRLFNSGIVDEESCALEFKLKAGSLQFIPDQPELSLIKYKTGGGANFVDFLQEPYLGDDAKDQRRAPSVQYTLSRIIVEELANFKDIMTYTTFTFTHGFCIDCDGQALINKICKQLLCTSTFENEYQLDLLMADVYSLTQKGYSIKFFLKLVLSFGFRSVYSTIIFSKLLNNFEFFKINLEEKTRSVKPSYTLLEVVVARGETELADILIEHKAVFTDFCKNQIVKQAFEKSISIADFKSTAFAKYFIRMPSIRQELIDLTCQHFFTLGGIRNLVCFVATVDRSLLTPQVFKYQSGLVLATLLDLQHFLKYSETEAIAFLLECIVDSLDLANYSGEFLIKFSVGLHYYDFAKILTELRPQLTDSQILRKMLHNHAKESSLAKLRKIIGLFQKPDMEIRDLIVDSFEEGDRTGKLEVFCQVFLELKGEGLLGLLLERSSIPAKKCILILKKYFPEMMDPYWYSKIDNAINKKDSDILDKLAIAFYDCLDSQSLSNPILSLNHYFPDSHFAERILHLYLSTGSVENADKVQETLMSLPSSTVPFNIHFKPDNDPEVPSQTMLLKACDLRYFGIVRIILDAKASAPMSSDDQRHFEQNMEKECLKFFTAELKDPDSSKSLQFLDQLPDQLFNFCLLPKFQELSDPKNIRYLLMKMGLREEYKPAIKIMVTKLLEKILVEDLIYLINSPFKEILFECLVEAPIPQLLDQSISVINPPLPKPLNRSLLQILFLQKIPFVILKSICLSVLDCFKEQNYCEIILHQLLDCCDTREFQDIIVRIFLWLFPMIDINYPDPHSRQDTFLIKAARLQLPQLIKLLLDKGADPKKINSSGETYRILLESRKQFKEFNVYVKAEYGRLSQAVKDLTRESASPLVAKIFSDLVLLSQAIDEFKKAHRLSTQDVTDLQLQKNNIDYLLKNLRQNYSFGTLIPSSSPLTTRGGAGIFVAPERVAASFRENKIMPKRLGDHHYKIKIQVFGNTILENKETWIGYVCKHWSDRPSTSPCLDTVTTYISSPNGQLNIDVEFWNIKKLSVINQWIAGYFVLFDVGGQSLDKVEEYLRYLSGPRAQGVPIVLVAIRPADLDWDWDILSLSEEVIESAKALAKKFGAEFYDFSSLTEINKEQFRSVFKKMLYQCLAFKIPELSPQPATQPLPSADSCLVM